MGRQWQQGVTLALGLFVAGLAGGAEQPATKYDQVSLSASAETEVPNDVLTAELFLQREGNDAGELAQEVNAGIEWAIAEAKNAPELKVRTLDYRTHPLYDEQRLSGWRVRQAIHLESADTSALSNMVGVLQQRLAVESISYKLSPGQRQQAENALIQSALEAFMTRAKLITEQFGRSDYRLVKLDVNTSGSSPRPMYRTAIAMRADSAAPAIEAGTQSVRVQVNGTIELRVQ